MKTSIKQFAASSRVLHWLMAALVLAMLFIGIGMANSLSPRYHLLVSIHKPLGVAILVLVIIRIINRRNHPPPSLPSDLPALQRQAAHASHYLLYGLMLLMPLVGWAMLSAAPYPIILFAGVHLPPIAPQSAALYAVLRQLHTVLAMLLFVTFLGHLGGALFHGLIRRDGVLASMASIRAWRERLVPPPEIAYEPPAAERVSRTD